MRRRGAILTWDFMIAIMIFVIIILSMLWLWHKVKNDMARYSFRAARREQALRLADQLVSARGRPHYWYLMNITNPKVNAIGLSGKDHALRRQKLDAFAEQTELNYTETKNILGLGREDYNVTITQDWDTSPVVLYSIGRNRENASDELVVRRLAILDNRRVEVLVRLSYEIT